MDPNTPEQCPSSDGCDAAEVPAVREQLLHCSNNNNAKLSAYMEPQTIIAHDLFSNQERAVHHSRMDFWSVYHAILSIAS